MYKDILMQLRQQRSDIEFHKPLSQQQIQRFENQFHLQIPLEYKRFLIDIGNGGFGPSSGIQPLADILKGFINSKPLLSPHITLAKWEEMIQQGYDYGNGLLLLVVDQHVIHGMYCQDEWYGQMVCIDLEHIECLPRFYVSFDEWYFDFLKETEMGYNTQYFGIQLSGDEETVLGSLHSDFEMTLYSLYKFNGLSDKAFNVLHHFWTSADIFEQLNLTSLFCYQRDSQQDFYLHQLFKNIQDDEMYSYWLDFITEYQRESVLEYNEEIKKCLSVKDSTTIIQALTLLADHLDENSSEITAFCHYHEDDVRQCVRTLLSQNKQKYGYYIYEDVDQRDLRQRLNIQNDRLRYYINGVLQRLPMSPVTIEDIRRVRSLNLTKPCPPSSLLGIDYSIIDSIEVLSYATNLANFDASEYITIHDFTPLISCHKLKRLILSQTQLEDISFIKDLKQLKILDMSHNQISDMSSLCQLEQLTELHIEGNPVTDWNAIAHFKTLHIFVDQVQWETLCNVENVKNWKIHIVDQPSQYKQEFIDFLQPIIKRDDMTKWLEQSIDLRNQFIIHHYFHNEKDIETQLLKEDIKFFCHIQEPRIVENKLTSTLSIHEQCHEIGQMGIVKAGILMKGCETGCYYLSHPFLPSPKNRILKSFDLIDLLYQEYNFYQNVNKKFYQDQTSQKEETTDQLEGHDWIQHFIFYDDFTFIWKSANASSMRVVYEARIKELLADLPGEWKYEDDYDCKYGRIKGDQIHFYVDKQFKASMPVDDFMVKLHQMIDLLFAKYFFTLTQKQRYLDAYEKVLKALNP